ncbi:MAG: chorismate synthase [Alcaligenaceae bacterium]|nr:chorismate synthase [Alcaligenaceae bacterium]
MSGNTLGYLFRVTNFGESHGQAIGCVVDGCPSNIPLNDAMIQAELDRRRPGQSIYVSQRQEPDRVQILSGVYQGVTTGAPITLLIQNEDARSKDYASIEQQFRPGHADYTYFKKYGVRDPRGGGRASARLTAPTVAAGAVAQQILKRLLNIEVVAYISQIGSLKIDNEHLSYIHQNPFFIPNQHQVNDVSEYLMDIFKQGDSIGAKVKIVAKNVPVGLGSPIYHRLDADLAQALMGLNAVKGVEIGDGFDSITQRGSQHGDEITALGFKTNHAGGILGGISTGQDIVASIALKPTSSIRIPRQSINEHGQEVSLKTIGRHDPCVGIRAVPVAQALMALTLLDHYLLAQASHIEGSL